MAEEGDGADTIVNPLEGVESETQAGPQKVHRGMRALGVDGRYNLEKIDLRGIHAAPWVSPTWAACFYKPGPDPDGNQPAILVVFPQLIVCSVVFTYLCFSLPVGDGCDSSLRKHGEWPTDHMLFWLTGWLQCVIMFLPIPLFGVFLARIGMPIDADSDRAARVKACGEDWATFLTGLKITAVASLSSVLLAMALARYWTGFPVPFTHLTAGFPGFFVVFFATALYLEANHEDNPRLGAKLCQLVTMQSCIFFNIASFAILSALIKTPSLSNHQLVFALGFTLVKAITKKVVTFSLKDEFDNAVPLLTFLNINAAVFPSVALPSAVSLSTYFTAAFVDVCLTFWSLNILWGPIMKLTRANDKLAKEQSEADEAAAKVETLKQRLQKANEELKREQSAAQDATAKEIEAKLQRALEEYEKERQDVDDAQLSAQKIKHKHDLGGLATEAIVVKQGRKEGETQDEFEARIGVDVDGDGNVAGVHDVNLTGAELADAEEKEFKVVLTILREGTEVLVPLLVVLTELFLYFGWNGQAVPTLMALSSDEFARSTFLKLASVGIQIGTCVFAAFCVNNLCVPFTPALLSTTTFCSAVARPVGTCGMCCLCVQQLLTDIPCVSQHDNQLHGCAGVRSVKAFLEIGSQHCIGAGVLLRLADAGASSAALERSGSPKAVLLPPCVCCEPRVGKPDCTRC